MIRVFRLLCFVVPTLSVALSVATLAANPAKTRVVLAGDSTVTDSSGWGAAFAKRMGPEAECMNFASGGQSSKSFRDEGRWKEVLKAKPDFVLIQFGHNDMPGKGKKRESDPETTYRKNLIRFVHEAREIGAQPILVTSMARRTFRKGRILGELKPWADAARKVAADERVPLIDLFARSIELLERLGPTRASAFHPRTEDGNFDRTHLNARGAKVMSGIVADELRRVSPELARLLK